MALYQKGVSLYLCPNTNNNPEWHDTIKHIAIEGKCFVFHVNQYFTRDMYPTSYHGPAARRDCPPAQSALQRRQRHH